MTLPRLVSHINYFVSGLSYSTRFTSCLTTTALPSPATPACLSTCLSALVLAQCPCRFKLYGAFDDADIGLPVETSMLASLGATPDNGGFHVMQVDANQENDVDRTGLRSRRE